MTTTPALRSTSDLLDELRDRALNRPKLRLHVNPDSAMWIQISVQNTGLSGDVMVVPDPAVEPAGKGWVEEIDPRRWQQMLGWAGTGQRVDVDNADLGRITGTLVSLDSREAVVDLGDDDRRHVYWTSIEESA
jgi:hypothetical protein